MKRKVLAVESLESRVALAAHVAVDPVGVLVHWGDGRTGAVCKDESITVGAGRTESVGKDETIAIGSGRSGAITAGDSITLTTGNARTETVDHNESITVHGCRDCRINEWVFHGCPNDLFDPHAADADVSDASSTPARDAAFGQWGRSL